MPEMHPSMPAGSGAQPASLDAMARWTADDHDYALGCECAYPALQIERWGQEDGSSLEPR